MEARRLRTSAATMIATAIAAMILLVDSFPSSANFTTVGLLVTPAVVKFSLEGNENLSKIIALVAVAIIVAALVRGRRKSTMIG